MKKTADFDCKYTTKGMIPIAKNIRVVDSQGNQHEATYLKRAKGLVKSGRARFVDAHTLCLARPPNNFSEDNLMSEKNKFATLGSLGELNTSSFAGFAPADNGPRPDESSDFGISTEAAEILLANTNATSTGNALLDRILDSIDSITREHSYIIEAIDAIKRHGSIDGSVGELVSAREKTNQKSLALLEKMYDDFKPVDHRKNFLKGVDFDTLAAHMDSDELPDFVLKLLGLSDDD